MPVRGPHGPLTASTLGLVRFAFVGFLLVAVACATGPSLDGAAFVDLLAERGARVSELDPGERMIPWFGGVQRRLCVDDRVVWVLEYPDVASRRADSDGIPPDANRIGPGHVEINGRWRVWAEGRLLVFYLGLDDKIVNRLDAVLGPTITPDAPPRGPFGGPVDPRVVARDSSCVSP